jgi:hypothetical protein
VDPVNLSSFGSGTLNLTPQKNAEFRPVLDLIIHRAGRRGMDFISIPCLEPFRLSCRFPAGSCRIGLGMPQFEARFVGRRLPMVPDQRQTLAPFLFLVLLVLSLICGFLYIPTNIDTAAYRFPRVLHWLGHAQWHWIHTYDSRLNSPTCNFEWLASPLIVFTRTDRFVFLINWLSYLMLPGLIFSVFSQLGVRTRVAWWWMWFLSAGWCYVFQAGSVDNDSLAAVFVLASVNFALRAKNQQSVSSLLFSMLAVALATGVKQTTLPLILPWLIAVSGGWKLARTRPWAVMVIAAVCLLVSFVPISIANMVHTGNWLGLSSRVSSLGNSLWVNEKYTGSPFWGVIGNGFTILIQNLTPPYFPYAERWNVMVSRFLQTPFGTHFAAIDHFGLLSRIAMELDMGIGPGVCLLTLLTILGACRYRQSDFTDKSFGRDRFLQWVRLAPWISLLVFMSKTGSFAADRLLAPYYLLLYPIFLVWPSHSLLVRRLWWQGLGIFLMLFTGMLLIVSFDRPLFPAPTTISALQNAHPQSKLVSSLARLYGINSLSYRGERNPLAQDLPQDGQTIGYATDGGILDPCLWLPLGSRKVEQVRMEDSPQQLRRMGIHYLVVEDLFLQLSGKTIAQILNDYHAELINQAAFDSQPTYHHSQIYLIRLLPE